MSGETLMHFGIAMMLFSVLCAVVCGVIYALTGKALKKRLEKEYGVRRF